MVLQNNILLSGEENICDLKKESTLQIVERIVKCAGVENYIICVSFLLDAEIAKINKKWRGVDKATDVLSFTNNFDNTIPKDNVLGDILISVDRAKEQADLFKHSFEEEIAALLAHGVLHLQGYDHEKNKTEETRQKNEEMKILSLAALNPKIALMYRG